MYARFLGYTLRVLVVANDDHNELKSEIFEYSQQSDDLISGESSIS